MNTRKTRAPQFLFDWFQQPANLLAQLRTGSVAVFRYGMIDRGVQHLFFSAFDAQRAAALARMFAAID